MDHEIEELNPPPRLLLGPGPVNADPRVLRAMSMPILGQFDPVFTAYMNELMELLRALFETSNRWALLVDGTARAGSEAILTSLISRGDRVLVPVFGRFGDLLCELARRSGAEVATVEATWGTVVSPDRIEDAVRTHRPRVVAVVHGETSTGMAQPLADLGAICRRYGALLYVDATASLGGMPLPVDEWQIDAVSGGLQKCLSGPPGSAPVTFNDRVEEAVLRRKHLEQGITTPGFVPGTGPVIQSNYFDLAMLMDYWSDLRLNHHTEATSMLYAARESVRIVLEEGLTAHTERHRITGAALAAGIEAMGLERFGDPAHRMPHITAVKVPDGVGDAAVRTELLENFGIEIGAAFGPMRGQVWRIGTMGYNCRKQTVLRCLTALEATLGRHGFRAPPGAAVDAALAVYAH